MSSFQTRHVKYVFADIVGFTQNRTVEAQVHLVDSLGDAFKTATKGLDTILLPTGDGMCAGIVDPAAAHDAHLKVALSVLAHFNRRQDSLPSNRSARVRIGINESVDVILTDVNGNRNLAGAGINQTQRIMSLADSDQILAGQSSYDTLSCWDEYTDAFKPLRGATKHSEIISVYQLIGGEHPFLDTNTPSAVNRVHKIELDLLAKLQDPTNFRTGDQVACVRDAIEAWLVELEALEETVRNSLEESVVPAFAKSVRAWKAAFKADRKFIWSLRAATKGTMWTIVASDTERSLLEQRAKWVADLHQSWFEEPS